MTTVTDGSIITPIATSVLIDIIDVVTSVKHGDSLTREDLVIDARKSPRSRDLDDEELERDIRRFDQMSENEVDEFLAKMNVDSAGTVAQVLAIVRAKMAEWNLPAEVRKK